MSLLISLGPKPVNACDHCRKTKMKCHGGVPLTRMNVEKNKEQDKGKKRPHTVETPFPKGKGKRRQKSPGLTDD